MRPLAQLGGPARPAAGGGFTCRRPGAEFLCYTPKQMRRAYAFNKLLKQGRDGRGETIAILDAIQDPTLSSDLAAFDSRFHISPPPSLEVIAPQGLAPFDPKSEEDLGWASEIALDVEWAHAIAPGAKILLSLAPSSSEEALAADARYVIQHDLGDVISMSYGESETCTVTAVREEEHALYKEAVEEGITLFAASGDAGATEFNCAGTEYFHHREVGVPDSDPNVTAVGGTKLSAKPQGGQLRR
jgi:subtilase family serine protease